MPDAASSVRKLLSDGHRWAVQVLRKNRELLDRLAMELLAHGFLEAAEIGRIVSPAARIQGDVSDDMDVTAPSDPSPRCRPWCRTPQTRGARRSGTALVLSGLSGLLLDVLLQHLFDIRRCAVAPALLG